MRRRLLSVAVTAALVGAAILFWGWLDARAMPVVRRATIALPGWPANADPMRVVLLGDIHIGNATTDADRLARIVAQVNALRPDLVLIAGDFIAGHDKGLSSTLAPELVKPLAALDARLGSVAVLGNHDHWTGAAAVRTALRRAHVAILDNDAQRFGELTVVGLGDRFTDHDRIADGMAAARRLGGPRLVLSHGPDLIPELPADAPLVAVSHTHCGQIVLPFWGPPVIPSRYGARYLCGIVREGGRATVVTAGLGTSVAPLRYGAPPDIWLLTLVPEARR